MVLRYVGYGSCFVTALRVAADSEMLLSAERTCGDRSGGQELACGGRGRVRRCWNMEAEVKRFAVAWFKEFAAAAASAVLPLTVLDEGGARIPCNCDRASSV